jgi:hypothetical protein
VATNCEDPGYARPAALVCDGANSSIIVQHRGELLPPDTAFAIAAGPNLVSGGGSSSPYVDIPLDDFNVNIWEHASNTAGARAAAITRALLASRDLCVVGLVGEGGSTSSVVFAVADGHDGVSRLPVIAALRPRKYFCSHLPHAQQCPVKDSTCGITAHRMAYFMKARAIRSQHPPQHLNRKPLNSTTVCCLLIPWIRTSSARTRRWKWTRVAAGAILQQSHRRSNHLPLVCP